MGSQILDISLGDNFLVLTTETKTMKEKITSETDQTKKLADRKTHH